jgi:hypothetical protein
MACNSNNTSHISKLRKKSVFFRVEKNKQAEEMAQSKYLSPLSSYKVVQKR